MFILFSILSGKSDKNVLELIKNNDVSGLKSMYDSYHLEMFRFAFKITRHKEASEEIVQDIFIQIWERRACLEINSSLKSYLFSAVKNQSINFLKSKHQKVSFTEISDFKNQQRSSHSDEKIIADELSEMIHASINSLPKKCKLIFNLSRNAELSYEEIAVQLGISKRTVQTQIGIALRRIREDIGERWDKIPNK